MPEKLNLLTAEEEEKEKEEKQLRISAEIKLAKKKGGKAATDAGFSNRSESSRKRRYYLNHTCMSIYITRNVKLNWGYSRLLCDKLL